MSKRILVPVWFCTLLSACALNIPVEAQVADVQAPMAQSAIADPNGATVASLQTTGQPPDSVPEELEPVAPAGESTPAEPVVTGPPPPPPLPPCPDRALGLQDEIAVQICQQLRTDPPLTALTVDRHSVRKLDTVIAFYAGRGYQPAWLDAQGVPRSATEDLLKAMGKADREGLRTLDDDRAGLRKRLTALQQDRAQDANRLTQLDLLLTDAFLTYGSQLLAGQLSPRKVDPDWAIKPRSRDLAGVLEEALRQDQVAGTLQSLAPQAKGYVQLREMLHNYRKVEQDGGWPLVASGAPGKTLRARLEASGDLHEGGKNQDKAVAEALRRFQKRHGLPETGTVNAATLAALNVPVSQRIQQIELNLERWRWMPEDLGSRYIMVNIPSYKMQVFEEGQPVMESKVVVGRQER